MTRIDALVSIAQTVLRHEMGKGEIYPTIERINSIVKRCSPLVTAELDEMRAAERELQLRYCIRHD